MSVHSDLGPSAAARWLDCTASVGLIRKYFPDGDNSDSIYAREGTLAHRAAELRTSEVMGLATSPASMRGKWTRWKKAVNAEEEFKDPNSVMKEMIGHAEGYAAFVEQLALGFSSSPMCMLETRVKTGIKGVWGTADCILASDEEIAVVDFKYGRGVEVDPRENPQLMIYALGAVVELERLLFEYSDSTPVVLGVYQPRVSSRGGVWRTTVGQIREFALQQVEPAVKAIESGEGTKFSPGDNTCRWCPMSGSCAAQTEWAVSRDFSVPESPVLDPDAMSAALEQLAGVEIWCKAVKSKALEMMYESGGNIPGWKVVRSAGRRTIRDFEAAVQALEAEGLKEKDVTKKVLLNVTDLQKKLGGRAEFDRVLGSTVEVSPGSLSVVKDSDKRDPVTKDSDAVSDFK